MPFTIVRQGITKDLKLFKLNNSVEELPVTAVNIEKELQTTRGSSLLRPESLV